MGRGVQHLKLHMFQYPILQLLLQHPTLYAAALPAAAQDAAAAPSAAPSAPASQNEFAMSDSCSLICVSTC